MATTYQTIYTAKAVTDFRNINVRKTTVTLEDGVETDHAHERYVLSPGDDLTGQPSIVTDITSVEWTAQIISDWAAHVAAEI